jgi:serine/threonine protein phosphatase 1
MRQFAIGDIHGCLTALQKLDQELKFGAEDLLVTLGDYIDRGPDTRGVIDYLIGLRSRCQLKTLRGNHEIMMLWARHDRAMRIDWISCGGGEALDSYGAKSMEDIPPEHWHFLEETLPYYETGQEFFVHANAYPKLKLADQPDDMLYWEFFGNPAPHQSGKRMICGHSAQASGLPLNIGHAVCIDTKAHGGGWLTCMDLRSGFYHQANQLGDYRILPPCDPAPCG